MRQFSAEYLTATRRGMWADSRAMLGPLSLETRSTVIDVGAGTGELTTVLREETPGCVVACDADPTLLAYLEEPTVVGDARRLPFRTAVADLVVCQALFVNLENPVLAIEEFVRVSTDLVAAIEPDNSEVELSSSVDDEASLARRARSLYLAGVSTDASLGPVADRFHEAGLTEVRVSRYEHVRATHPPYSSADVEAARRRVTGAGIGDDRDQILAGGASAESFDELRADWRAMGREVVAQMQAGEYHRREVVPFYVTVGRLPD